MCAETDDQESEAAYLYLFDADDRGSVEVICDNCRGIGHFRRVCPSAKSFAVSTSQSPSCRLRKASLATHPLAVRLPAGKVRRFAPCRAVSNRKLAVVTWTPS